MKKVLCLLASVTFFGGIFFPNVMAASELPNIEEFIIRDLVERWKPRLTRFGFFANENEGWVKVEQSSQLGKECVVLIHGLDEIGTTWDDMAPALEKHGHEVLSFCYPNDQSIDRSAALFRFQLQHLRNRRWGCAFGVNKIGRCERLENCER